MEDLVSRARDFAIQAHARIHHVRKYTQQPYSVHLRSVAELVAAHTQDPASIAAAWLHDTVEDTTATIHDIEVAFGRDVAGLVSELTDISKPGDGNRSVRKEIDRQHLAAASVRAKTVKLADLIDNCRDICQYDRSFGLVYLSEMSALLDVLGGGDEKLYAKACETNRDWSKRLGSAAESTGQRSPDEDLPPGHGMSFHQERVQRLFAEAFTAQDISEPLSSFDEDKSAAGIADAMDANGWLITGLRAEGRISGYLRRSALSPSGVARDQRRTISPGQIVAATESISDVIHVLTRHDHCFVSHLGEISGVITRADIQKPVVRMWLFGMITMVEMALVNRIRSLFSGETWQEKVSSGRLEKARALRDERLRRDQPCDLLDCLQLSDKAQILMHDPAELARLGFPTRKLARKVTKELESLRNNLAHAQDIVTNDWAQIARLTHRFETVFPEWEPGRSSVS